MTPEEIKLFESHIKIMKDQEDRVKWFVGVLEHEIHTLQSLVAESRELLNKHT